MKYYEIRLWLHLCSRAQWMNRTSYPCERGKAAAHLHFNIALFFINSLIYCLVREASWKMYRALANFKIITGFCIYLRKTIAQILPGIIFLSKLRGTRVSSKLWKFPYFFRTLHTREWRRAISAWRIETFDPMIGAYKNTGYTFIKPGSKKLRYANWLKNRLPV